MSFFLFDVQYTDNVGNHATPGQYAFRGPDELHWVHCIFPTLGIRVHSLSKLYLIVYCPVVLLLSTFPLSAIVNSPSDSFLLDDHGNQTALDELLSLTIAAHSVVLCNSTLHFLLDPRYP